MFVRSRYTTVQRTRLSHCDVSASRELPISVVSSSSHLFSLSVKFLTYFEYNFCRNRSWACRSRQSCPNVVQSRIRLCKSLVEPSKSILPCSYLRSCVPYHQSNIQPIVIKCVSYMVKKPFPFFSDCFLPLFKTVLGAQCIEEKVAKH